VFGYGLAKLDLVREIAILHIYLCAGLERVENEDSGKLAYGILRGQRRAARPLAPQVERTFSWMACCRRLVVRYEPRADIHKACLQLRAS
jgi:transposase